MARTTVYNSGLTDDYDKINPKNQKLVKDAIQYYKAMDRTPTSITTYTNQLKIFFCWNYKENEDKFFIDLKKRDFIFFINYVREELQASSARVASLKAVLSSFSNVIENMYEDEYPTFRNIVRNIDTIIKTPTREKTVLSNEQIQEFLDKLVEMEKYQLACYLALLASSGCRKSEMIQMKPEFFVKENEVFDGFMYLTNKIRSKGRGKAGKVIQRYVIKSTFQPYFDLWMKEREDKGIDCPYLFVTKHNNIYEPAKIYTMDSFAETISKLFNIDFYNHCVRHFFCTKLKRLHLPDDIVAEILHWSSTALVKIYNDIPQEETLATYFGADGVKEVSGSIKNFE